MLKGHKSRGGFALPTVLIASVVMLTVLAVSVSSVAAIRNSLKVQYYQQLAKAAGEAGVAYAKACLAKNSNIPLWSDDKPLTPSTDCAGNQLLGPAVQLLVVGGGGGGGAGIGGGGGGGGVDIESSVPVSNGNYTVTVGNGGAGGPSLVSGSNGGGSAFGSYTVSGGGGGGGRNGSVATPAGDGGSGGGGNGSYDASTGTGAVGGAGNVGEGNDGGMGSAGSASPYAGNGGGGGGAGSAGGNASGTAINTGVSGDGGIGMLSDMSGEQVYYGAGGAGGRWGTGNTGIAGITGGGEAGAGNDVTGGAGQANTGGGGGGGSSGDGAGGAGGSGIVIVRYADNGSITATGGTVYSSGPYKVHRFTSSSIFKVTATGTSSCPSDPRCSVMVNDTLRSSFQIGKPTLDESGRAISIPNNGYVELLRKSSGQVWRTYRQPATQVAVVPDLCSGAAESALGWSNAVLSSNQASIPNATTAHTITLSDDDLNAGLMYFRKDFTVTTAGTYTVAAQTANDADIVEVYVDGVLETTARNDVSNGSVALSVGCHTVTARLTNKTLLPRHSQFTAAIQQPGAEPIVATDTSWRVSAGSSVHFSDPDFYADPDIWGSVVDMQNAQASVSTWAASTGDNQTHLITDSCNTVCPPSSSAYFRDSHNFVLTSNTDVLISALCDDDCAVYIDGNLAIASSPWSAINQQTETLTAGTHRIAARVYNAGTATNPSKFAVAVYDRASGTVLARTDASWLVSPWVSGTNADNDPMSYESSFRPSPAEIVDPVTYDVLAVAGGGGGAGNCNTCGGAGGGGGGGVVYRQGVIATTGTQTITVGAGGAAGVGGASRTNGTTGANTIFGSLTVKGGGGGAMQSGSAGLSGGSGGGGSGGGSPAPGAGGAGTAGQGFAGGAGATQTGGNYNGGGGGGAGGAGMAGTITLGAGDGGPGLISYITGSRGVYGAGGGGGAYSTYAPGVGDDGAGNGANQSVNGGVGYPGIVNTGGGGGGGDGMNLGGGGGAGGSGIVVIRVVKGSVSVTLGGTGARTQADVTINGITYTVYKFTSGTSTFNITSINQ